MKNCIFLHIYYPESFGEITKLLMPLLQHDTVLLVNFVIEKLEESVWENFAGSNIYITTTSNIGKDIGGKLALLDLYINLGLQCQYFLFLHDKKSPHSSVGRFWRNELFKIAIPENLPVVFNLLERKETGIVAVKTFIKNEWIKSEERFDSTNDKLLQQLITKYRLQLSNYSFVAGAMYWVKASLFLPFFNNGQALKVRSTLERGNVLDIDAGSYTHSWERMFSFLINSQGYHIKGI